MKYKKKEILVIIIILCMTLILAFFPALEVLFNVEEAKITNEDKEKYVTLTITGELIVDEVSLKVPYGYSYGNIIEILNQYTNEYSIIDYESTQRFIADTNIVIESKDTSSLEANENSQKISINQGSEEELITLYGIGEKRATKIIEYRQMQKISSFEELKKILGVSDEVIHKIKEQAIL